MKEYLEVIIGIVIAGVITVIALEWYTKLKNK